MNILRIFQSKNGGAAPIATPAASEISNRGAAAKAEAPVPAAPLSPLTPPVNIQSPLAQYPRGVTAEMISQAEATRRENRVLITRMHLENEARHQAAAEARELEAKKAAENAEHERNRPRTFEEKYRHMTARDTISPTAQFIRALVDRQGVAAKLTPIFQRIRPALTEYARLNNERKEIGPNAARMLVKAHIATQHAKALAGQDTSEQYPNAELLEADFAVRRSALRERMKAICTEVNKEVGAVGEILKTAARKQTEELSAAERAAAKAMDHPYEPSVMLRASAAAGMNIDYIVKVQCMLIPGMDIDCFLFGLIEL